MKLSQGCEIIVSDRLTAGPADFFAQAPASLAAFLRVAVDIRNIDVAAASKAGILVTHATPGFLASVAEQTIGFMVDLGRHVSRYTAEYRAGLDPQPVMGRQLAGATLGILGYGAIGEYLARLGVVAAALVLAVAAAIMWPQLFARPHVLALPVAAAGALLVAGTGVQAAIFIPRLFAITFSTTIQFDYEVPNQTIFAFCATIM